MATSSSFSSNASPSLGGHTAPLWRFVKRFEKNEGGGGRGGVDWQCNFCGIRKTTSYTRVVNHLMQLGKGIAG